MGESSKAANILADAMGLLANSEKQPSTTIESPQAAISSQYSTTALTGRALEMVARAQFKATAGGEGLNDS
jgi:hypothetical protein